jgi:hypothetical protein
MVKSTKGPTCGQYKSTSAFLFSRIYPIARLRWNCRHIWACNYAHFGHAMDANVHSVPKTCIITGPMCVDITHFFGGKNMNLGKGR